MNVVEDTARRIQERMNVAGDKISYPVNWDSEKQQRAFFATNGFGHGIPYVRTNAMANAWSVTRTFDNQVDLFAPHPAGAVFGMPSWNWWQSNIHRGRWVSLQKVFYEEIEKLPAAILDRLRILFNGGQG